MAAQHPLRAIYHESNQAGAQIGLLGADYPDIVAPGGVLPFVLYWSANKPPGADYTVFVHLVDSKGSKQAQRDTGPRSGTYPMSQWQANEVVVDEASLELPANIAPGSYTVRVGLYLQKDGNALPPLGATNGPPGSSGEYVALGPIRVGPGAAPSK